MAVKEVFDPTDFLREAEAMCRLDHPNIIHFYGYVKSPCSLVMEYCDQSLEAYLKVGVALSLAGGIEVQGGGVS